MSKAISRRDFLKVTGAVGAAGLLAACGGNGGAASSTASSAAEAASVAGLSSDPVTLTMSWWGGESRHNAYQEALKAFSAEHTTITVNPTFAAWSGWEDTMSTKFAGGVAEDVCQINWNWLYNYSGNGQTFLDLNSVTDYLDMSQWDDAKLGACNVANAQQCVPISMTGRIFYWNMTTFNKAGITEVPSTEDDLFAAGKAFQEKLGDDYYPLHLGAYDRMILMVFYLESKYGKDWADPTTSTLNYTADEIAEGIDFIKSLVDGHVIMPLPTYYGANGDGATHQSNEWITGKIAGIFEWDSAASKYQDALDEENKPGFTVGEEIKFGDYNGGFSKVSMGRAITKTCKNPAEAATLTRSPRASTSSRAWSTATSSCRCPPTTVQTATVLPTSPTSGSPARSPASSSGIPLLPSTRTLWTRRTSPASPLVRRSSSAITTAASPRSPWAWPSPRPARTPLRLLP